MPTIKLNKPFSSVSYLPIDKVTNEHIEILWDHQQNMQRILKDSHTFAEVANGNNTHFRMEVLRIDQFFRKINNL